MKTISKLMAGAALAATLAAGSANAGVVLFDDFNAENGGVTALNYTGFTNWDVAGNVDLVKQPDYGIGCFGGSGSCVDLDGTTGPGQITTKTAYAFAAGDTVTLSWMDSGNQRGGGTDNLNWGILFSGLTTYTDLHINGDMFGGGTATSAGNTYGPYSSGDPWILETVSFKAVTAGSAKFYLGTTSADNVGPLVDNVTIAVVPEPATWSMMIAGFGMAGVALRRRRVVAA